MKSYTIKNLKNNLKKCRIPDTLIEQRIKKSIDNIPSNN